MKIESEGKEVAAINWELYQGYDKFCSELSITTYGAGPEEVSADDVTYRRVYAIASGKDTTLNKYYPTGFIEALGKVYPSFNGDGTLEDIYSSFGINIEVSTKTKSQFWSFPQLDFISLIKRTIPYAPYQGGGGLFTWLSDGILIKDCLSESSDDPVFVTGDISDNFVNLTWNLAIPSSVNVITSTLTEDTDETFEFDESPMFNSVVRQVIYDDRFKDYEKTKLYNRYAIKKFTSSQLKLSNAKMNNSVSLLSPVQVTDLEKIFYVFSMSRRMVNGSEISEVILVNKI